jgi:hypothetical protein
VRLGAGTLRGYAPGLLASLDRRRHESPPLSCCGRPCGEIVIDVARRLANGSQGLFRWNDRHQ